MKNIKFIFAALVSLAALSCVELESPVTTPETNQDSGLVTLTLSTGEATKTHIVGGTEIHWDEGDKIKVFTDERYDTEIFGDGTNAFSFSMSGNPNGNFASFSGSIAKGTENIWVVYPESSAKSCSDDGNGSDIVASLPSNQKPVATSFDTNLNISVAKSKVTINGSYGEYELTEPIFVQFKNVCSLLKFTAPDNETEISSVTITANEDIAGDMTIDYSGETPVFAGIANGSKSITMTGSFVAGKDYYFVVAPVDLTGISMTIQANNETKYIVKKADIDLQPGVVKNLGSVNLEKMTKVSASAAHQYPSDVLTGTNVTFSGLDNVSSVNLTINQASGSAKRSVTSATSSYESESDNTWPYLPQGAYTFSGSFTYDGVNVTIPATSFTVPAPTFTVGEFAPFTSYSKYLENKTSVANGLDGSTIYTNVTASISSALLEKSEYGVKVNDKDPVFATVEGVKCVGFGGNEWKSHTVSQIKWTFDGVSVTKALTESQTVHVTGIPYTYNFRDTNNKDTWTSAKWTLNGTIATGAGIGLLTTAGARIHARTSYRDGWKTKYKSEQGYLVSPKFVIPADVDVTPVVGIYAYDPVINLGFYTASWTYTGYVGPVSSSDGTNINSSSFTIVTDTDGFSPQTKTLGQFKLKTDTSYVSISPDDLTVDQTVQLYITSFKLEYK